MLPKDFPWERIWTVAFDVEGRVDYPMNITRASDELKEHLLTISSGQPLSFRDARCLPRPMILIGHTYGTIFIFKALLELSNEQDRRLDLLQRVAGVLAFCYPSKVNNGKIWENDEETQGMARLLQVPEISRIFAETLPSLLHCDKVVDAFYRLSDVREVQAEPAMEDSCPSTHATRLLGLSFGRDPVESGIFNTVISYRSPDWRGFSPGITGNVPGVLLTRQLETAFSFPSRDADFISMIEGVRKALTTWGLFNRVRKGMLGKPFPRGCEERGDFDLNVKDFRYVLLPTSFPRN
jgi:hypothetical protein